MESPTLLVVDHLWYDGHVPERLRKEHRKSHIVGNRSAVVRWSRS